MLVTIASRQYFATARVSGLLSVALMQRKCEFVAIGVSAILWMLLSPALSAQATWEKARCPKESEQQLAACNAGKAAWTFAISDPTYLNGEWFLSWAHYATTRAKAEEWRLAQVHEAEKLRSGIRYGEVFCNACAPEHGAAINEVGAKEFQSVSVKFSQTSIDALKEIQDLNTVTRIAQYSTFLQPFAGLLTAGGPIERLNEVRSLGREDWDALARQVVKLSESERKTIWLIADNTRRELEMPPKAERHSEEIAFWTDMTTAFR